MPSRRGHDDSDYDLPPGLTPGTAPVTGILPAVPAEAMPDKHPRSNAATAASAAGVRALSAQAIAFYFRAPVKAFFRTRVDYLAWARTVHQTQAAERQLLASAMSSSGSPASRLRSGLHAASTWVRGTTPGVVTSAVRHYGWGVIPHQILPPLIANVGVGAVLYTSYLQILGRLHEESSKATRTVYPPPSPVHTFTAGLLAGGLQSFIAAPLDAIQARFDHRDIMPVDGGKPRSMWAFSAEKLREIGVRGIFAGYGLSLLKDSLGSAIFFSAFEYVKAQGYYRFVTWYYGDLNEDIVNLLATRRPPARVATSADDDKPLVIRPHYSIEPIFLLLAGVSASFTQQVVLHPLTHFQVEHWDRLEEIDEKAARLRANRAAPTAGKEAVAGQGQTQRHSWRLFRVYYRAYQATWAHCSSAAAAEGRTMRNWLYRGFWWNTIRQVPSTSAGLIIFELFRRKYGLQGDEVRINQDGYDILLN
ncbi:mitochondrial carrier domain-containing protein [Plectosphaerella plurivora]|uniref:Mitochondrial carrier domain-containing protein n=1 Tax=Plectosphaerella plurivora TaxID=936078 RepID=A0A9P8V3G2_9PEZI|nr:mitochondrial carrier domain-containing protein [Plectosphaerella plurivora]